MVLPPFASTASHKASDCWYGIVVSAVPCTTSTAGGLFFGTRSADDISFALSSVPMFLRYGFLPGKLPLGRLFVKSYMPLHPIYSLQSFIFIAH